MGIIFAESIVEFAAIRDALLPKLMSGELNINKTMNNDAFEDIEI